MKESEAPAEARWLLIGNSRWHWAAPAPGREGPLRLWHTPPCEIRHEAPCEIPGCRGLVGWAAVGAEPAAAVLPPAARLRPEEVPLADRPPWLGIDRALVGWAAWREQGGAVLVADAGTVLSLTRVDRAGRFAGGRLLAGGALQLRAMAEATCGLPRLAPPLMVEPDLQAQPHPDPPEADPAWPHATAAAMRTGVLCALAAAIASAAAAARRDDPGCSLVLTGGDAEALAPWLRAEPGSGAGPLRLRADLALQALAALRPCPGL